MNLNQIFSELKAGRFHEAFILLGQEWKKLRWEIRAALVGVAILSGLVWIYSSLGGWAALWLLPLGLGALIAAGRPEPTPAWVDGLVRWADNKRQRALAKGTFFSRWVMRPFYAGMSRSGGVTTRFADPYLRAGATLTLQTYTVYLALMALYIAITAAVGLACLAIFLWVLAYAFTGGSGAGHRAGDIAHQAIRRGMSDRSEEKEDLLGRPYTQHYDDQYNPTGSSEPREDFLGRSYEQHLSNESDPIGHSEHRQDFLGNPYLQNFDEQGRPTGHSEVRQDFLGRQYTQHFDQQGNPIGRSEEREDILGHQYTKNEPD